MAEVGSRPEAAPTESLPHMPGKEYLAQSGTKKGPQYDPFSMVAENVYLKVIWLSMVSPSGVNFMSVRERSSMAA